MSCHGVTAVAQLPAGAGFCEVFALTPPTRQLGALKGFDAQLTSGRSLCGGGWRRINRIGNCFEPAPRGYRDLTAGCPL